MLLFPNTTIGDTFLRGQKDCIQNIIQLLEVAVTHNGIRVRILTSKDIYKQIEKLIALQQQKVIVEKNQEYKEQQEEGRGSVGVGKQEGRFEIHLADTSQQQQQQQQQQQRLQTKVSYLVVDSKVSLVEEEPKAYNKEISLATYSNSESTVLAYISIFETLWTQTELKIKM
jgi:organic radical activating enzyme